LHSRKFRTICFALFCTVTAAAQRPVWTPDRANAWYASKGWLRGSDFIPSTAVNQLEMWQEQTFDPATIDRELGYAESIGFNCMRVFLHHLAWQEDPAGFRLRVGRYLDIADRHHISTIFVFFDDCWNARYHAGLQPAPRTGIHNSGWVRDPGILYTEEPRLVDTLETYVKDILTHFGHDRRVLLWDLYNEPGNSGNGSASLPLLEKIFSWGREINPDQPLSAGIWDAQLTRLNTYQLAQSDVITYHNYEGPAGHRHCIDTLRKYGRPLLCTEFMARLRNSTFFNITPILKAEHVAAINWGLVTGKTNTKYAWDTPMPDGAEPKVWFHDIFRPDGTPFDPKEVEFLRRITADSIPLGGNAWRVPGPGPGLPGDSSGGYVGNNGIGGWTDSSVHFDVWFRTSVPGTLQLSVCASVPRGTSRLLITVGKEGGGHTIDIGGDSICYYPAGEFLLPDTGYHLVQIRGLERSGPAYASIPAICLQGPAISGRTSFVPNDEGNFFHWGRRGPSVHLNYPLPAGFTASWFYNEITVPQGQDVQGSYFMACGFAQGYFGMQVNGPAERHVLFSVWSPFETDDPSTIPDSLRVGLVKKGAHVHAGNFGNEGSGGQSWLNYPWKAGRTYRFLLHAQPAPKRHTLFTAWWYAPEEGHWRLIACFNRPHSDRGLTHLNSFLENFEPEQGNRKRCVLLHDGWAGDDAGHWEPLRKARFTVDDTGRKGYRLDYAGGLRDGGFYLENDGFFNQFTPAGTWLERPGDTGDNGPGIKVSALPGN